LGPKGIGRLTIGGRVRLSDALFHHPLRSQQAPALAGHGNVGLAIRAPSFEHQAATRSPAHRSAQVALAQFSDPGQDRSAGTEAVASKLDDRDQDFFGRGETGSGHEQIASAFSAHP
jgi:hypothetical protein